jgi:NAD(P)-dependent dehydrogenase (short-subunit alcohol dehydrogenase family)
MKCKYKYVLILAGLGYAARAVKRKREDYTGLFQDKVVIVTGGASGIGRALCQEMGRLGALVVVSDMHGQGAKEVAEGINAVGGRARAVRLDVTLAEDVQGLVDEVAAEHGLLDYMFNNAGIAVAGDVRDMNLEHWRRIMDVNLMGVLYGTLAAYELMARQGFGHIVNTASLAGLVSFPTATPYAATKHAVVGLSTSLRVEAADLGVKVSAVCPGFVRTNIFQSAIVLKARREDALTLLPFELMDVNLAARAILRGVAANRSIINFPAHARALWWLHRLNPDLLFPLGVKMVRGFRSVRQA